VVELLFVGCRVPVVGCRVLTSSRVSLTLVVVLVPGCQLSGVNCWLLIFCVAVVAQFFYCRCPALFTIVENNTLLAKQRFHLLALENTVVYKNYSTL